MRHDAPKAEVAALRIALRKALDILKRDTDAIHAGVDFQVKRKLLAAGRAAARSSCSSCPQR